MSVDMSHRFSLDPVQIGRRLNGCTKGPAEDQIGGDVPTSRVL